MYPLFLDDFIIHRDIADRLKLINDDIPNIVFCGLKNSGKKVLCNALINNIFNTNIYTQKFMNKYEIKISGNTVNIEYVYSQYHYEINLYEYGLYDRNVITEFIQNLIQYKTVNEHKRIIVLNHFDKITVSAQMALRRILEIYHETCRFILIVDNISKLESAILSRFIIVRVPVPNEIELREYIKNEIKSGYTKKLEDKIVELCDNDMYKLNHILSSDNEEKMGNIEKMIELFSNDSKNYNSHMELIFVEIDKPDLLSMGAIRSYLYNMILLNISTIKIFNSIFEHYFNSNKLDIDRKLYLVNIASSISHKIDLVEHDLIALEFFILKVKKLLII